MPSSRSGAAAPPVFQLTTAGTLATPPAAVAVSRMAAQLLLYAGHPAFGAFARVESDLPDEFYMQGRPRTPTISSRPSTSRSFSRSVNQSFSRPQSVQHSFYRNSTAGDSMLGRPGSTPQMPQGQTQSAEGWWQQGEYSSGGEGRQSAGGPGRINGGLLPRSMLPTTQGASSTRGTGAPGSTGAEHGAGDGSGCCLCQLPEG